MPYRVSKALLIVIVLVSIATIALALAAILGNPAWSGSTLYAGIKDFQTIIGGGLAFAGIWLGFIGNRRRDERLRRQEARALALALYAELKGALITCNAFITQISAALAKPYDNEWLAQEILGKNIAPRVRTMVFEANVDKLGLLGEPLVGGADLGENLIVEIVFTFDQLLDYTRIADKEQVITRRDLLKAREDLLPTLKDTVIALKETMDILQAYIYGGLPAATKAADGIMADRKKRHDRLGKELGIVPATTDEGDTEG